MSPDYTDSADWPSRYHHFYDALDTVFDGFDAWDEDELGVDAELPDAAETLADGDPASLDVQFAYSPDDDPAALAYTTFDTAYTDDGAVLTGDLFYHPAGLDDPSSGIPILQDRTVVEMSQDSVLQDTAESILSAARTTADTYIEQSVSPETAAYLSTDTAPEQDYQIAHATIPLDTDQYNPEAAAGIGPAFTGIADTIYRAVSPDAPAEPDPY